MFHSLGSMVCLRLNCCTRTCFPTVGRCFVAGLDVRIFDDELSDYGEIILKWVSIRIGEKVWCRRREDVEFRLERRKTVLNALGRIFGRRASEDGNDPMAFLDEYAAVMNRHARVKVRNGFKWGRAVLSVDVGIDGLMLWSEDGRYCFDEEERGQVRKRGAFNSASMELTQKVMVNYTASILRHSLGLPTLGVPMQVDDLPAGWSLNRNGHVRYGVLEGPNGERLDFEAEVPAYCVSLAWLYDVTPSELLNAYMLPDGGPLLRQWLGYPYLR